MGLCQTYWNEVSSGYSIDLWEYYHESGPLSSKGYCKEGKLEGLYKYFNTDGTVSNISTKAYKNGKKVSY